MTIKEFKIQLALGSLTYTALRALATSPKTHKKILDKLSTDEEWNVRVAVASNINTPLDVLKNMTQAEVSLIRWTARETIKCIKTMKRKSKKNQNKRKKKETIFDPYTIRLRYNQKGAEMSKLELIAKIREKIGEVEKKCDHSGNCVIRYSEVVKILNSIKDEVFISSFDGEY
ncbi:hypothetical protein LCGC14_1776460 [marine sediment metagenome]|uniref:Uncharacterized protein n=1 Tax=marine sediment metagenome TaxID=412755 RepID=A0A0F9JWE2_9ZZZZ